MAQKRKLSDADILVKVQAKVKEAVSETALTTERERVMRYYNAEWPRKQALGNSSFISQDVFEAVESMKSQVLETFSGNTKQLIRCQPRNPRDPKDQHEARVRTKYMDTVLWEDNDLDDVCHDILHDGLIGRTAVAMTYWDEAYDEVEERFSKKTEEEVLALASQEDVTDLEAEADEYGMYEGSFTRRLEKCRLRVEAIPPEEWFIEPRSKRREDGIRGRRVLKSRAELVDMGFPKAKVDNIGPDDDADIGMSPENLARHDKTSNGLDPHVAPNAEQPELEKVMLYETYMELALYGDGKACLCKIMHAGNEILDVQEVDEDPFVDFTPIRVPHTFWGASFASRVIQTQNARTQLTRSILDHTALTNNPRYQVVQGALLNPRELLDGRFGGVVNVTRPDGVLPVPQANLNPFVFETIQLLRDSREENTGISSLSQGLNKDAISTQNSADLVDSMVTLSQVRQKIVARRFGKFLKKLYLKAYKIVAANEKTSRLLELAGEPIEANPRFWDDQFLDVSLSLHLGYGESEKEAAKYTSAYVGLKQDPTVGPALDYATSYKILTDIGIKQGVPVVEWLPAQAPPPPQPDPIEMGKLEVAKMSAEASIMASKAAMLKAETNQQVEMLRAQMEQMQAQIQALLDQREADRDDLLAANEINVAQRELELAEKVPDANTKAIYSANS